MLAPRRLRSCKTLATLLLDIPLRVRLRRPLRNPLFLPSPPSRRSINPRWQPVRTSQPPPPCHRLHGHIPASIHHSLPAPGSRPHGRVQRETNECILFLRRRRPDRQLRLGRRSHVHFHPARTTHRFPTVLPSVVHTSILRIERAAAEPKPRRDHHCR